MPALISVKGETMKVTIENARLIANLLDLKSQAHLTPPDLLYGTCQMLGDLERLARNDGCTAAAWALEWILEASREDEEEPRSAV